MRFTRQLSFKKMHVCGNDFVIIYDTHLLPTPSSEHSKFVRALSDRRTGIGCDQLLIVNFNEKSYSAEITIYNCDGSPAATCLNGTACVALDLIEKMGRQNLVLRSFGGIFTANSSNKNVTITPTEISISNLPTKEPRLAQSFSRFTFPDGRIGIGISIGNPHLVFFVKTKEEVAEIHTFAEMVRKQNPYTREVNISVSNILEGVALSRIIEAGAGETLACGSASAAIYLTAKHLGLAQEKLTVCFPGGNLVLEAHKDTFQLSSEPKHVFCGQAEVSLPITTQSLNI